MRDPPPLRELITQKLLEADLSMSEASVRIGKNASYLQQFLHRGVPAELRENERQQLAQLLGVDENQLRGNSVPLRARPYAKKSKRFEATKEEAQLERILKVLLRIEALLTKSRR
jgi:hypothetical protein